MRLAARSTVAAAFNREFIEPLSSLNKNPAPVSARFRAEVALIFHTHLAVQSQRGLTCGQIWSRESDGHLRSFSPARFHEEASQSCVKI
jgi:hypothetical protein